jgi:hypothetical protein
MTVSRIFLERKLINTFNTATFDIVTYRQALENFILANHD